MPRGGKRPGSGRPKSSDNSLIKKLREQLSVNSDALISKAVEQALEGDSQMLKFCLDKLLPSLKPLEMPMVATEIDVQGSLVDQSRQALAAILDGQLTATEGLHVQASIAALAKMVELEQLETRIAALEQGRNNE